MKTAGLAVLVLMASGLTMAAPAAQAQTYAVTGARTGFAFDPPPPVTPKLTDTPANPTFTGTWQVTPEAVSGTVDMAPFKVDVRALLFKATLEFAQSAYSIEGGSVEYDAATRTLKLAGGTLKHTGKEPKCTGSSTICEAQPTPDMEKFELKLIFADAALSSFKGEAKSVNLGGSNGNSVYTWTFSGQAAGQATASSGH